RDVAADDRTAVERLEVHVLGGARAVAAGNRKDRSLGRASDLRRPLGARHVAKGKRRREEVDRDDGEERDRDDARTTRASEDRRGSGASDGRKREHPRDEIAMREPGRVEERDLTDDAEREGNSGPSARDAELVSEREKEHHAGGDRPEEKPGEATAPSERPRAEREREGREPHVSDEPHRAIGTEAFVEIVDEGSPERVEGRRDDDEQKIDRLLDRRLRPRSLAAPCRREHRPREWHMEREGDKSGDRGLEHDAAARALSHDQESRDDEREHRGDEDRVVPREERVHEERDGERAPHPRTTSAQRSPEAGRSDGHEAVAREVEVLEALLDVLRKEREDRSRDERRAPIAP